MTRSSRKSNTLTPLQMAIMTNDVDGVRALLAAGANATAPNDLGIQPLHYAVRFNKDERGEVCDLLIKNGADINASAKGMTLIAIAAMNAPISVLRKLLQLGADPGSSGGQALQYVITEREDDRLAAMELLIKHGGDVNVRVLGIGTLLHAAVAESDVEMFDLLIHHGADLNRKVSLQLTGSAPPGKFSAFEYAVLLDDAEMVRHLVGAHGVDPNEWSSLNGGSSQVQGTKWENLSAKMEALLFELKVSFAQSSAVAAAVSKNRGSST
jgi:ankyrin repeat protein